MIIHPTTHTAISASTLPYPLIQRSMTHYTITNTTIYSVAIIYMPQSKQQSMIWHSEYKNYRTIIHEQGDRSPAAGGPPPMRIPGAARRTPNQLSKTVNFVLLYCFFCVFYLCYSISASPKTHKPRGRASDVSTISTCFSVFYDLLPTPPPISVRKVGYHCRVLVWLLALLLN